MKRLLLALGAVACAPIAFAQTGASPYVTVNASEATYDVECAAPLSCLEKDKGYKAGVGWQFNRYVAAELAYNDLGQADFKGTGFGAYLHATAYELAAVGSYPLGGVFSVLGRLGLSHGTAKYGRDLSGEQSNTALTFGAGLQLDFTKNVAARLQWQRFKFDSGIGVDMLSVGLVLYPR